ncbi:tetratricopeptide repeat protein [Clostridioides difficile]|uniref:tetratricopeptide repeat protein n=1 Tax=Clostridioides difficile TaxID=1496 RepID=UPI00241206BD|nr:tetratricopeptide repeat protein [Clostridioides difficile]
MKENCISPIQNNINGNNIGVQYNYYKSNNELKLFNTSYNSDITLSKNFIGREEEIEKICKLIDNGNKVLISGMGGIGKTEICKTLYNKYVKEKKFDYVVYLNYKNTMNDTILNSTLRTQISNNQKEDLQYTWKNLLNIANNKRSIIFIDNINKTTKEDSSLKKLHGFLCPIIITSRNIMFEKFDNIEIGFMNEKICKKLFLDTCISLYKNYKYSSEEERLLEVIIKEITFRHTQTVILLSHIMIDNDWNIHDLKKNLLEKSFNLAYLEDGINDTILIEEYKKLFTMSKLEENKELDVINILESFSIFPYLSLPINICKKWLLDDARASMQKVNKVSDENLLLKKIYKKGWLEYNETENSFTMHPIISKTITNMRDICFKNHKNLIKQCLQDILENSKYTFKNNFPYYIFAENIIQYLYDENSMEIISLLNSLSNCLQEKMEYTELKKALNNYKIILDLFVKNLDGKNPNIAILYNNISSAYEKLGEVKKALNYYEKALDILEHLSGKEIELAIANICSNMALSYQMLGENKKALKCCKKALKIRETELGTDHTDTAITYNITGLTYHKLKNDKEALNYYEKALKIREQKAKDNYFELASLYNNMGASYAELKENEKALDYYKKTLEIREHKLELEHDNYYMAKTYNNMAITYGEIEENEKALYYYEKSLEILIAKLGYNHLDLADVYNNAAQVYHKIGKKNKALSYLKKAFYIYVNKLDINHYKVKQVKKHIAMCK